MWSTGLSLGLSSEEFWRLTVREFDALQERSAEREKLKFLRTAMVQATLCNIHRDPNQRAFTPADFMPAGTIAESEKVERRLTNEQMLFEVRTLNALFGGSDLTPSAD